MITAKLFQNGRSQAVRLPKEYRFRENEVYIRKHGDMVVLFGKRSPWAPLMNSLDKFTGDFMAERNQPKPQVRKGL